MRVEIQLAIFEEDKAKEPLRGQLLKWVGNKQRVANEIIAFFPKNFGTYFEPFLGSGGVLGTLSPTNGIASDSFRPLIAIWQAVHDSPETLKRWYRSNM